VSLELTTWAGNFAYGADSIHYPTSVAEVQELVARLPRAKALGTRHRSWCHRPPADWRLAGGAGLRPHLSSVLLALAGASAVGTATVRPRLHDIQVNIVEPGR
jgi:xylitol oxidase